MTVAAGHLRLVVPEPAREPWPRRWRCDLRRPATGALWAFATVALALGAARAVTTTYVPVLLERIADRPGLIGAVMLVNAAAGFVVPLVTGLWSDRRGSARAVHPRRRVVSAGGLVAVAFGNASSYASSALAAATSTSASTRPARHIARWSSSASAPTGAPRQPARRRGRCSRARSSARSSAAR